MKRLTAIFLSTLLLISTMGLSFSTHYCGGKAVKSQLVLGNKTLSCGMPEMEATVSASTNKNTIAKDSCCKNHQQLLTVEDDFNTSVAQVDVDFTFIYTFFVTALQRFYPSQTIAVCVQNTAPPLSAMNLLIWVQTFLL